MSRTKLPKDHAPLVSMSMGRAGSVGSSVVSLGPKRQERQIPPLFRSASAGVLTSASVLGSARYRRSQAFGLLA